VQQPVGPGAAVRSGVRVVGIEGLRPVHGLTTPPAASAVAVSRE
jgi:hypothetical protein